MAFKPNIDLITDGEDVDAAVINVPLIELQNNDNYLKVYTDLFLAGGAQGVRGYQGYQGNIGYQGYQGNIGYQGFRGYQGDIGYQGNTGYQGNIGYQGPAFVNTVTTVTGNYSATTDEVILCNAVSGSLTISLPTAVGVSGKVYSIKKIDSSSHLIFITPNGSEKIDNSGSVIVDSQYVSVTVVSDGTNWWII